MMMMRMESMILTGSTSVPREAEACSEVLLCCYAASSRPKATPRLCSRRTACDCAILLAFTPLLLLLSLELFQDVELVLECLELVLHLVHELILLLDDLLLALGRGGEHGHQVLVRNCLLVSHGRRGAEGPHDLRHHGLQLVGDETEPHVLGLCALLEGVGHRPQLPQQPHRGVARSVLAGGSWRFAGLVFLRDAWHGLLGHLSAQEFAQRPLQGLDLLLRASIGRADGVVGRPSAVESSTSAGHLHDPASRRIDVHVGSVVFEVRRGRVQIDIGAKTGASKDRQPGAHPHETSDRE
mmetsp:Transcript_35979/g.65041  ORF Transcript_35979/g.65041 Transcript_35979/m.65041 type:complete len:297 (+) Transcript_35979:422-1312(+)